MINYKHYVYLSNIQNFFPLFEESYCCRERKSLKFYIYNNKYIKEIKRFVKVGDLLTFTINKRKYIGEVFTIDFNSENTECYIKFRRRVAIKRSLDLIN